MHICLSTHTQTHTHTHTQTVCMHIFTHTHRHTLAVTHSCQCYSQPGHCLLLHGCWVMKMHPVSGTVAGTSYWHKPSLASFEPIYAYDTSFSVSRSLSLRNDNLSDGL